jgi:hypothetical protein
MGYLEDRMMRKNGLAEKLSFKKERKPLKKVSDKKTAELRAEKEKVGEGETEKELWFKAIRKKLSGTCACGCGQPSQKNDDMYFRHSCCHIFPKAKFESVKYHPMNFVERRFFGGCHSVMDDTSMDRWPNMADWQNIVEKFHILAPCLTDDERKTKFYQHLEKLIYQ